ncbi:unnamed protein product, partial [Rotaria sp. Silwood2]
DLNHTHFILLDDKCGPNDETWRRYGYPVRADLTIQLRAEIEQEARCSSHYRHSRERVIKEDGKDIITGSNEKRFHDMIRSEKGFFLINTFLLCPDDPEFKLSDAILQALLRGNVDIYGTIENPLERTTKLNGLVVFNGDDVIRQNGYIKQVSIVFSNFHNPSVTTGTSDHVVLYIISPTSDTHCFQVVDVLKTDAHDYQYDNNKLAIHTYKYAVYVEQGQYLAIGFDKNSRSPSYLSGLSSCYTLDIDAVNRVYMNKTSIRFQWGRERVAISFQIILTSGRIILFHNK